MEGILVAFGSKDQKECRGKLHDLDDKWYYVGEEW